MLEALTPAAAPSWDEQSYQPASSMTETLQQLVAASCKLQTVALVALELSGRLQHGLATTSAEAASRENGTFDGGLDAAATEALRLASSASAQVTADALTGSKAARGTTKEASHASHDKAYVSDASTRAVQAVLSCLEGGNDELPANAPWSQDRFKTTLSAARDQVWEQLADAVTGGADNSGSKESFDPDTLALLDAAASIAPLHFSASVR